MTPVVTISKALDMTVSTTVEMTVCTVVGTVVGMTVDTVVGPKLTVIELHALAWVMCTHIPDRHTDK